MPVAPELAELLRTINTQPPMHALPIAELRRTRHRIGASDVQPVGAVEDGLVQGPGGAIRVRRYAPGVAGEAQALVVFFHGGGFVFGSLDGYYDHVCRALCAGARCQVVSVDYRLAPEHKFPAALDDCTAVVHWVAQHAEALGADRARIFVAGGSAGANLAAATALRLRDESGPALRGQVLFYPVADYPEPPTPSLIAFAEGHYLTRADVHWFWTQYLARDDDRLHPYAAIARAPSLAGLPKALVITAEYDPLRDEGERYARRMQEAGVDVDLVRYDGMLHGFLAFPTPKASEALAHAGSWIRSTAAT